MSAVSAIIAHQGGWDEALLIGTPILVIIGLLWLAKRRVDAAHTSSQGSHGAEPDVADSPGAGPDVTEPDRRRA